MSCSLFLPSSLFLFWFFFPTFLIFRALFRCKIYKILTKPEVSPLISSPLLSSTILSSPRPFFRPNIWTFSTLLRIFSALPFMYSGLFLVLSSPLLFSSFLCNFSHFFYSLSFSPCVCVCLALVKFLVEFYGQSLTNISSFFPTFAQPFAHSFLFAETFYVTKVFIFYYYSFSFSFSFCLLNSVFFSIISWIFVYTSSVRRSFSRHFLLLVARCLSQFGADKKKYLAKDSKNLYSKKFCSSSKMIIL